MDKVVFVSIDKPKRWSEWHSRNTDNVYYSDFYSKNEEVNDFLEKVKHDFPDNNFSDNKCNHEYYIKYVVLNYSKNDTEGFETLCRMMRAYGSYNNRDERIDKVK